MASGRFRAVIFDIGRVLVRVDVGRAMRGLADGIPLAPEEIWPAIEKDPRWPDWQEGRISPRDWHLHLTKRLGGKLSFEEFCEAWNRALDPNPIQPDSFFEGLDRQFRLGRLSNTDPIHVAHMEKTFSFFNYVPAAARIYSCGVGASKPNPVVYQRALRAVKANASEAVFVDDLEANVEAAKSLGMAGICCREPHRLSEHLAALRISPRA